MNKKNPSGGYSAYVEPTALPAELAVESSSESAWAEFQDASSDMDVQWANTVPMGLFTEGPSLGDGGAAASPFGIPLTRDLLTGHSGMDADHATWIGLANEALAIVERSGGVSEFRVVLDKFLVYTKAHFQRENAEMEHVDYPYKGMHLAAHAGMLRQLIEFRQICYANTYFDTQELCTFLRSWLPNHILKVDKGLAQALRATGD